MSVDLLQRRLDALRAKTQRLGGFLAQESWNQFRVAATCPPSTRLHVRGGRFYSGNNPTIADIDDYEKRAWTVPALVADVGDLDSVGVDVTFANAHYYQFFVLELRIPKVIEEPTASDWWFYIHTIYNEFATAGEAEAYLMTSEFQNDPDENCCWKHPPYPHTEFVAYPLCGLVLRNNGQIGSGCPILPIDPVNRGRSYMWPVDFRSLTSIYD